MQYVILLDDRVVNIFDLRQFEALKIEVDKNNTIITEGEFYDCELYEDVDHRFPEGSIQGKEFILLHREYRTQTDTWKKEWMKVSPPTETVHHLTNPMQNTERRHAEWDSYVIPRAEKWWKERGWKIIWGLPHEGCHFELLSG